MKKIVTILFVIISSQTNAQLFVGYNSWLVFFVEVNSDNARIEIFNQSYPDFMIKKCDEVIYSDNSGNDTLFCGSRHLVTRKLDRYYLHYKLNPNQKFRKIKLDSCQVPKREEYRKWAYATEKGIKLRKMQDSLSYPGHIIQFSINPPIREVRFQGVSYIDYIRQVDSVSDSLEKNIIKWKSPLIDSLYCMINPKTFDDSAIVFRMLSSANYNVYYGKYLLYQLALQKPEFLIHYINNKPENRMEILRVIRRHPNVKEIVQKIRLADIHCKGSREIIRQKFNGDIETAGIVTLYTTIIISELALLAFVIVWIF